ncbi:hypothetical protein Q7P37_007656 [Cladosporium fusiforme]
MQPTIALIAATLGFCPAILAQRWEVQCDESVRLFSGPKGPIDCLIGQIPNTSPYPLDGTDGSGAHSWGGSSRGASFTINVIPNCDNCGYSAFGDEINAMARDGYVQCVDSGLNNDNNGRFFNYRVKNAYYDIIVGGGVSSGVGDVPGTRHVIGHGCRE